MGINSGVPSSVSETSFAFGARKRKVTLLSLWTSGEISRACDCAHAAAPSRIRLAGNNTRFIHSFQSSVSDFLHTDIPSDCALKRCATGVEGSAFFSLVTRDSRLLLAR